VRRVLRGGAGRVGRRRRRVVVPSRLRATDGLEHRTNAQEMGHAVARNIMGMAEPFEPVPYFWTDHYDVRVQLAGVIPRDATVEVVEGDADADKFVQAYSVHGAVAGVLAWNSPRQLAQHRRELVPTPLS
jgi:3-phenylpropionate/trans-cinnamate dioxygenase ferredoxin reductase subunit